MTMNHFKGKQFQQDVIIRSEERRVGKECKA